MRLFSGVKTPEPTALEIIQEEARVAESFDDEAALETANSEEEKLNLLSEEKFAEIDAQYDSMEDDLRNGRATLEDLQAWINISDVFPSEKTIARLSKEEHTRLNQWGERAKALHELAMELEKTQNIDNAVDEVKRRKNQSAARIGRMSKEQHQLLDEQVMS